MARYQWFAILIISAVGVCLMWPAPGVAAQSSKFQQTIAAIECVYTITNTGVRIDGSNSCHDQPYPVVTDVETNNGRVKISGGFSADKTRYLRVWLNGQWFTAGVSPQLSTAGDTWVLNLMDLDRPLTAGNYQVSVEVETVDGFLLQNIHAAYFYIEAPRNDEPEPGTGTNPLPVSRRPVQFGPTRLVLPQLYLPVPYQSNLATDLPTDSMTQLPRIDSVQPAQQSADQRALPVIGVLAGLAAGAAAFITFKRSRRK